MDLTQFTPTELDKLTKDQLVTVILEEQTYSDANLVKDKYGNNVELTEVVKDAYGVVVGGKTVKWTYYDAEEGIVDEIAVEDEKERLLVKHFTDGSQPVATKTRRVAAEVVPVEKEPWYTRLWHTLWPPVSDGGEA